MAFSMANVVVKKRNVDVNIKNIFSSIGNNPILTPNVKEALNIYLRYRLKHFGVVGLQKNGFDKLVNELLENCCNKHINDISFRDVNLNELNIIYQIKRAMELRAVKTIYCKEQSLVPGTTYAAYIKPRNDKTHVDIEAVREYLKEFELI